MGNDIDIKAFKEFMEAPRPGNEAKTIAEYAAIVAFWDAREPQTGMPRGLILDEQVIQEIPTMHKIVFGTVQILTHPDAGQIYKQDGGGFGISAGVYFSIAQAAGMSFPDEYSTIDVPASSFPDRVVASAAAIRTDLAGQIAIKSGRYVLDIETKCAKLEERKGKEAADRLRMNLRESNVQRAITGAQRAAIKAHYGKLRRKWQEEDFEIPLIIPRLIVDKSMMLGMLMQTEAGQQAMAAAFFGAQQAAFGAPRRATLPAVQSAPLPALPPSALESDDDDDIPAPAPVPAPEPPPAPSAPQIVKAVEWRKIYALAAQVGYGADKKAEVQEKARVAAVAAGAVDGASSDTWTREQWDAARAIFAQPEPGTNDAPPADLPDEPIQPPKSQVLPTASEYPGLTEADQIRWLRYLLDTRKHNPTRRGPEQLKPEERARWYEMLLEAPLATAAA